MVCIVVLLWEPEPTGLGGAEKDELLATVLYGIFCRENSSILISQVYDWFCHRQGKEGDARKAMHCSSKTTQRRCCNKPMERRRRHDVVVPSMTGVSASIERASKLEIIESCLFTSKGSYVYTPTMHGTYLLNTTTAAIVDLAQR